MQNKDQGERNLKTLLKNMKPELVAGEYVFCHVKDIKNINLDEIAMVFREKEGLTIILKKELADKLRLNYSLVTSWIALTVHSSLAAVGLTAAFSRALAENNISCNVVAAFYHDHIFVNKKDAQKAIEILDSF